MKRIFILIAIMFLASCASKFNVEKANTYLLSHPDRPADIKEALSVGKVVPGMNEEEVTICMGKPDTITTTQSYLSNQIVMTNWGYLNGMPSKRVFILFRDGIVRNINVITQSGTRKLYPGGTINPGPIIRHISPGPHISPPIVNRNCSSKPNK